MSRRKGFMLAVLAGCLSMSTVASAADDEGRITPAMTNQQLAVYGPPCRVRNALMPYLGQAGAEARAGFGRIPRKNREKVRILCYFIAAGYGTARDGLVASLPHY